MTEKQLPFDNQDFADILGGVPSPVPPEGGETQVVHQPAEMPVDQHPAAIYLAGLSSKAGRRSQQQALNKMAEMLGYSDAMAMDWSGLRHRHTTVLRAQLISKYAPATVNKFLAALRSVLKHTWKSGQMTAEAYHRAVALDSLPVENNPVGRELSAEGITALLGACEDDTKAGARDGAVIALLYAAGLRRSEIVSLDLNDYDNRRLDINGERTVSIGTGASAALEDWIAVRGTEAGPLFLAINKGDTLRADKRLTAQAIYGILSRRAKQAGIEAFSPHDLRRTFISDLLEAGAEIATVAQLAGHKDVTTTMRYDLRLDDAKQKVVKLLHVPYKKRIS